VVSARQGILAKDDSPPRLKAAIKEGKGLIHYPEGYIKISIEKKVRITCGNKHFGGIFGGTLKITL